MGDLLSGLGGLLGGVLSAGSGGLFGIVGSIATTFLKQRAEQKAHEREIDMIKLQMEVTAQEGSWKGLEASQRAAAAVSEGSHRWSNDIKNLFRPFITTLVVVGSYLVFRDMMAALNATVELEKTVVAKFFDYNELVKLVQYYVYSLVFSASAAIMWWFGDRAQAPPGFKNL